MGNMPLQHVSRFRIERRPEQEINPKVPYIDSDKKCLATPFLGMLYYAFRNCTVFIYVELEPLCLVALLRIDNLVERTAGESGNHLNDIVLSCTTGKNYFAFGIAKFPYKPVRNKDSPIEIQGFRY